MKKFNFLSTIITLVCFLIAMSTSSFAQFSGGDGSAGDPFQIATPADLMNMQGGGEWVNYILTDDIDMQDSVFTPLHSTTILAFQANLNGKGHIISNLTITPAAGQTEKIGFTYRLMGHIDSLGFENLNVNAGSMKFVGGIAGEMHNNANYKITNCYINGGTINGGDYSGGLVGIAYADNALENCFTDVHINSVGGWKVGGIAGKSSGAVNACAVYGTLTTTAAAGWGYPICELDGQSTTDCYYIDTFGGNQTNMGATGLTGAQLKDSLSYVGFDFSTPIWKMHDSIDYAVLNFFPIIEDTVVVPTDTLFSGGDGSTENPYQIATPADLMDMQGGGEWVHYILTADIDMADSVFTPLHSTNILAFQADLNGKGHIIKNLTVTPAAGQTEKIGFIYRLMGHIDSLGFENLTINAGSDKFVGGIAGEMHDNANFKITNCYINGGTINGGDYTGGIAGIGYANNVIENCFVDAHINSDGGWKVGGIIGKTKGPVSYCSFYGTLVSSAAAGWGYPICELDGQSTTDCYYIDTFGGNQTNVGATPLTVAQLTDSTNYTGFDFATPVWKMWNGNYAVLNFFPIEATSITKFDPIKFQVFPNPSNGILNVVVEKRAELIITNVLGMKVQIESLEIGRNQLDLSSLNSGHYFITVKEGYQISTKRIVVKSNN